MKFSDKYISSICPELGKWEVQILKNHLLDMHHPNDIYEQLVTVQRRTVCSLSCTDGGHPRRMRPSRKP